MTLVFRVLGFSLSLEINKTRASEAQSQQQCHTQQGGHPTCLRQVSARQLARLERLDNFALAFSLATIWSFFRGRSEIFEGGEGKLSEEAYQDSALVARRDRHCSQFFQPETPTSNATELFLQSDGCVRSVASGKCSEGANGMYSVLAGLVVLVARLRVRLRKVSFLIDPVRRAGISLRRSSATTSNAISLSSGARLALIVMGLFFGLYLTNAYAASSPQYLLFHIFNGGPDSNGIFHEDLSAAQILALAQNISDTVQPSSPATDKILGFDIGPITMDQGETSAIATINAAFDAALATNLAVAIHLDDWIFWKNATLPDGSYLVAKPGTTEWSDWAGTTALPLDIGWLSVTNLAPPMCYANPLVQVWTQYWLLHVVGPTVVAGYNRLVAAGKARLFAGIFAGWESNIQGSYCSLSTIGYSATNPPTNLQGVLSFVLSQHIALWTKSLAYAGVPTSLIYTHLAWPTVQPWVAFNSSSRPGWTNYVWPNDFEQIYGVVGSSGWVQAEGSNVASPPDCPLCIPDSPSPYSWETYLAKSFNHGASLVSIYEAFQGETGAFATATGPEAIAAYQKFLTGGTLVETP